MCGEEKVLEKEPMTRVEVDTSKPTEAHLKGYAALSFLYFHTPSLQHMSVKDMSLRIMPPLVLGAYHIFHEDHMPRAAVTWAMLGDEAAKKLKSGEPLAPTEWASGDELWVMESISPFKNNNAGEILSNWVTDVLAQNVDEFHFLRPDKDGHFTRHMTMTRTETGWTVSTQHLKINKDA